MAKRIIWSRRAQDDRKDIFKYWNRQNKLKVYSKKLNKLFKETVILIVEYPEIGKPTDDKTACIKIVGDFLMIYEMDKKNNS